MSTRAQVRFATREDRVSFSEHPEKINAQFYVHSDGYPEGLGVEIAESILNNQKLDNWELEHVDTVHADIEYMYYIWQDFDKGIWISIFELARYSLDLEEDKCVFVGRADKLIGKYKLNTNDDG